jgi:RNA polymerase sigma-70 factor (ECF subfamily)
MTTDPSDEDLFARFRDGDREAFSILFDRHWRRVVHFALRMTGDLARAEEAAQETFLRAARAASTWEPRARFTTWLHTVAYRATLNLLRAEGKGVDALSLDREDEEGGLLLDPPAGPRTWEPDRIAEDGEARERILSALAALPPGVRGAFVLVAAEGFSCEEAAAVLGVTVQAVKGRVFRARESLCRELATLRPDGGPPARTVPGEGERGGGTAGGRGGFHRGEGGE